MTALGKVPVAGEMAATVRVLDIGELEGQRWRFRGLLVLDPSGSGNAAQHQKNGPLLVVIGAKHQDRIVCELMVGDNAVPMKFFRREIVAQRICGADDRLVAGGAAVARPDDIDLNPSIAADGPGWSCPQTASQEPISDSARRAARHDRADFRTKTSTLSAKAAWTKRSCHA